MENRELVAGPAHGSHSKSTVNLQKLFMKMPSTLLSLELSECCKTKGTVEIHNHRIF